MHDVKINTIRSIDRAIDILQAFTSEMPSLSVDGISKITGIPNSTVYRILCTLEKRGLVQFVDKTLTYQLGLKLIEFGNLSTSTMEIQQIAEDDLIDLHNKTKQTVLMAIKTGDEIFYLFTREKQNGLKFSSNVGEKRPFIFGALGPVLLAFSSQNQIDRVLNKPILQHTPYTINDKEKVLQRLENIRKENIFLDKDETHLGVIGFGSPIFGVDGIVIAAIGVIGPTVQLEEKLDEVKPLLLETASKISYKMGYKD
jgi:IclR family KDG regulon transcriptional repressor